MAHSISNGAGHHYQQVHHHDLFAHSFVKMYPSVALPHSMETVMISWVCTNCGSKRYFRRHLAEHPVNRVMVKQVWFSNNELIAKRPTHFEMALIYGTRLALFIL
jgi:hypothetical protein